MNIIFILIPLGLLLLLLAVAAFFWAVRSGQFDDLESPAWRVVLDDDRAPSPPQRGNTHESLESHTEQGQKVNRTT